MNNQRSSNFFFNVDWVLVFIFMALCTIGWFNIHSAAYHPTDPYFKTDYGKQLIYIIVGVVLAIIILLLETRFITALAPAFYVITSLLLMLVLVVGRNAGALFKRRQYQGYRVKVISNSCRDHCFSDVFDHAAA
jgi:rod shape determining protein RodA